MAEIYYDDDVTLDVLQGKTMGIVGYGSQGHAQAQNLRDSGLNVIVAEVEGTDNYKLAKEHGFEPTVADELASKADIISILVPDTGLTLINLLLSKTTRFFPSRLAWRRALSATQSNSLRSFPLCGKAATPALNCNMISFALSTCPRQAWAWHPAFGIVPRACSLTGLSICPDSFHRAASRLLAPGDVAAR